MTFLYTLGTIFRQSSRTPYKQNYFDTCKYYNVYFSCPDINECLSADTNVCDPDFGVCRDRVPTATQLGYTCSCQVGYTGDGFICSGKLRNPFK
jgi:hypothetical protein